MGQVVNLRGGCQPPLLVSQLYRYEGESRENFLILLRAARRPLPGWQLGAASHSLSLLHRYETRLQLMYWRTLRRLWMSKYQTTLVPFSSTPPSHTHARAPGALGAPARRQPASAT